MIRPQPNNNPSDGPSDDFRVQNDVFEKMKEEIRVFKGLGVRGFVFGILKDDDLHPHDHDHPHKEDSQDKKGSLIIDQERCRELLKIAREGNDGEKVRCTFHRAFDRIEKERMGEQLEVLINLSFTSLLTSGGSPTSVQGKAQIRKLVEQAAGRIEIIVGGGVRSHNINELIDETGAQWFHSSAVTGEGEEVDGEEVRKLRAIMCTQGVDPVGNLQ
ncbi:hypothetical protein OCU04_009565 [Sclerotinia nivalis]|uniref:Copper homeostasis protein cutC homolog n=1 Tax=Sclerotinia nivalis TaxID=352851 RepID=A0A9X0AIW1_9HELO|nr:hypothetical protein OCU04_009565 [Sclerotinia nivalis]